MSRFIVPDEHDCGGDGSVKDAIQLHRIGSRVRFVIENDPIEATVNQISIKGDGYVEYQVVWWNGRIRTEAWVQSHEIKATDGQGQLTIGFR